VTDNRNPRFSYSLESDRHNVALKSVVLTLGDWSIETTSIAITYEGPSLKPFQQYTASIKVIDDAGEKAEAIISFETGRLNTPWKAKWITDGSYHFKEAKVSPKTMTFRKEITINKDIQSVRIYSTALGIYELNLNGEKVGRDYFAPGFTSYKNQLQYQIYDITNQIKKHNELTVIVGGGWAVGAFTYKRRNRVYANRQALLCEILILFKDGTQEVVITAKQNFTTEKFMMQRST